MSDGGPISVPVTEDTPEQAEEREKGFRQSELITELLAKLKPQSAAVLQTAKTLEHEAKKEELSSLIDDIDQLGSVARDTLGRFDTAQIGMETAVAKAVRSVIDYTEIAHKDAKQAEDATGDNDEVRNTAFSNMLLELEHADGALQQVS